MSNEPHIVDARRRARMLSRQTGSSYQSHLDEVARAAGRTDWKTFLKNPGPVPEDLEPQPSTDLEADRPVVEEPAIADPMPEAAAVDEQPAVDERPVRRRWFRRWAPALAVLAVLCAIVAATAWQQVTTAETATTMSLDRASHGSAAFIQTNIPIARNVQLGDMRRVDLVLVDSRAQMASWTYIVPRYFGFDPRIIYGGGQTPAMRKAAKDNPLLLIRMHANCRTRKWRIAGVGAARSYDEAPVRVEYYKRPPRLVWLDLGERNRHAICDAPDSTSVPYQEMPSRAQIAVQSIPAHDPRTRSDAGDTLWYGVDLLHPMPVEGDESSTSWHKVKAPAGWTEATQSGGWTPVYDDTSGPALDLSLDTRTPQAAVAAARIVADQLIRCFDLGPRSRLLTTAIGYLVMKIRFSPTLRPDRPLSSTLRLVELTQTDKGITLRATLRGRYTRDVQAWLSHRPT